MTTQSPPASAPARVSSAPLVSRIWRDDTVIAENLAGDDLAAALRLHRDASAWWVVPRDAGDALASVADHLALDWITVHDVSASDNRAKFQELPLGRLVVSNALAVDHTTAEVSCSAVSMVATDRLLIVVADDSPGFRPGEVLAKAQAKITAHGVPAALHAVTAELIRTYEDAVGWLEEASDALSEALFEERPFAKGEQIWAFRLRRALTQVRRVTDPMRDVVDEVAQSYDGTPLARVWNVATEHHHRVAAAADALREALASAFDTSLALSDLRMNSSMKKLTGWAAIVAVPTLVSGFVGMNVRFPLYGTVAGFWIYTLIMVVSVLALYVVFRRKEWI